MLGNCIASLGLRLQPKQKCLQGPGGRVGLDEMLQFVLLEEMLTRDGNARVHAQSVMQGSMHIVRPRRQLWATKGRFSNNSKFTQLSQKHSQTQNTHPNDPTHCINSTLLQPQKCHKRLLEYNCAAESVFSNSMAIHVQAYKNAYRLRECLPLTRKLTAYKSAYRVRECLPLTRLPAAGRTRALARFTCSEMALAGSFWNTSSCTASRRIACVVVSRRLQALPVRCVMRKSRRLCQRTMLETENVTWRESLQRQDVYTMMG